MSQLPPNSNSRAQSARPLTAQGITVSIPTQEVGANTNPVNETSGIKRANIELETPSFVTTERLAQLNNVLCACSRLHKPNNKHPNKYVRILKV